MYFAIFHGSYQLASHGGIHAYHSAVIVKREVYYVHTAYHLHLVQLLILEDKFHLFAVYLIVFGGINLFGIECLVYHMHPIDGIAVHIQFYLFTHKLLTVVPKYRILVHSHAGVARIEYEGVAHCLYILTESAHLIIRPYLAIKGVGVGILSYHPYCVGMQIEGIALRVVDGKCHICYVQRIAEVIEIAVFATEDILVYIVCEQYISKGFTDAAYLVAEKGICCDCAVTILDGGAIEQRCLTVAGVIISDRKSTRLNSSHA